MSDQTRGWTQTIEQALAELATPSKELLAERALLSRVDTKFLVPISMLPELLRALAPSYAALRVPSGAALASYRSLYLDSPELACFHAHRCGRRLRHKVRVRHYLDRELSFLEVKSKRNPQVTDKHRRALPSSVEALDEPARVFLREHVGSLAEALVPVVRVDYFRASLIGVATHERVTLDLGLTLAPPEGQGRELPPVAVLEIKQSPYCPATPVMRALTQRGLRPAPLSKYTLAISQLFPLERKNRLMPSLRGYERISRHV